MNGEQIKVDYASSTVTYVGVAVSGATENEEKWAIRKITLDANGKIIAKQVSGGVMDQKFKWSDRADSTKITYE